MVLRKKETFELVIDTSAESWSYHYIKETNITVINLGRNIITSLPGEVSGEVIDKYILDIWFIDNSFHSDLDNLYSVLKIAKSFVFKSVEYKDFTLYDKVDILNSMDSDIRVLYRIIDIISHNHSVELAESFFYKAKFDIENLTFTSPSGSVLEVITDKFSHRALKLHMVNHTFSRDTV